jgi:hypothetical protein
MSLVLFLLTALQIKYLTYSGYSEQYQRRTGTKVLSTLRLESRIKEAPFRLVTLFPGAQLKITQ